MTKIGYARRSTDDLNLDIQRDKLKRAGCNDNVYEEKAENKQTDPFVVREQCLNALEKGDTLVVWRLDRLGRSLLDIISVVASLDARGINFESLSEKINTESDSDKLIYRLFASLVMSERYLIKDRAQAGLAALRARGRLGGRHPALGAQEVEAIKELLNETDITVSEVAKRYGVSRTTIYKHAGVINPIKTDKPR